MLDPNTSKDDFCELERMLTEPTTELPEALRGRIVESVHMVLVRERRRATRRRWSRRVAAGIAMAAAIALVAILPDRSDPEPAVTVSEPWGKGTAAGEAESGSLPTWQHYRLALNGSSDWETSLFHSADRGAHFEEQTLEIKWRPGGTLSSLQLDR